MFTGKEKALGLEEELLLMHFLVLEINMSYTNTKAEARTSKFPCVKS